MNLFNSGLILRLPCLSYRSDTAFLLELNKLSHSHQAGTTAESSASVVRDVVGRINEIIDIVMKYGHGLSSVEFEFIEVVCVPPGNSIIHQKRCIKQAATCTK